MPPSWSSFGLAICLVVPASLRVSRLVENTLDVQQTIDSAAQSADDVEKEAGEADDAVSGGWLSQIGEQITSGVTGAIDAAEQALSRFIDAIAVLLIVNCVVPILVLWFFLWSDRSWLPRRCLRSSNPRSRPNGAT